MAYNLKISLRAQKEIINTIDLYISTIENAPNNFVIELQKIYRTLKINPFFEIRYKNIRSIKIKKYPYSIYFIIDEERQIVKILSCFHNKRNPLSRPTF